MPHDSPYSNRNFGKKKPEVKKVGIKDVKRQDLDDKTKGIMIKKALNKNRG